MKPVTWIENSATSCQLKWTWSKLFLQVGVTQCCWHNPMHQLDDLENFHNTPEKIHDRELMLKGDWPAGCGYCKNIESRGGVSDRILHNRIPDMRPVELEQDPQATHIDPTVIEIIFSNTCNMSCIYCTPEVSSLWNNEVARFGPINIGRFYKKSFKEYDKTAQQDNINKFWTWLEKKYLSLTKLTALGGEPLLEDNTYRLIEFFDQHPNDKLQLLVFTNLMVPKSKLAAVVSDLARLVDTGKIRSAQISTSMEAAGSSAEFIRYGVDMVQWEDNLRYVKQHPNIDVIVNGTINCLSVKSMPDLIRKLKEIGVPLYFSGVDRVPFLEVGVLPQHLFVKEFDEAISMLPEWSATRLGGIRSLLSESGDPERMLQLRQFLDEISSRRNLDWRATFPWASEVLDVV